jgi:hypothetical protein
MDGTLLKTDSLIESIILLLKSNALYLFMLCFWILRGKACLKHELAAVSFWMWRVFPFVPNF